MVKWRPIVLAEREQGISEEHQSVYAVPHPATALLGGAAKPHDASSPYKQHAAATSETGFARQGAVPAGYGAQYARDPYQADEEASLAMSRSRSDLSHYTQPRYEQHAHQQYASSGAIPYYPASSKYSFEQGLQHHGAGGGPEIMVSPPSMSSIRSHQQQHQHYAQSQSEREEDASSAYVVPTPDLESSERFVRQGGMH